jgi:hypothetical protein
VFDRASKEWKFLGDILPSGSVFKVVGNTIFLTARFENQQALLQLDPKTRAIHVVASGRRMPAVAPLDVPNVAFAYVRPTASEEVAIYARAKFGGAAESKSTIHLYHPEKKTWRLSEDQTWPAPNANAPSRGFAQVFDLLERGTPPNPSSILTLRIRAADPQTAELPLKFVSPTPGSSEKTGWAKALDPMNLGNGRVYACESGLFLPSRGAGFWFLPRAEFDQYLTSRNLPPIDLTPNNNANP